MSSWARRWARLEISVVALWPWLVKSTAGNNLRFAESICLHNLKAPANSWWWPNACSFRKCFCKVKFWYSGWLFDDVISSLHAEIAAKAPRPRIPLDSCGLDNTLLYALDKSANIHIFVTFMDIILPRPVQVSVKKPCHLGCHFENPCSLSFK